MTAWTPRHRPLRIPSFEGSDPELTTALSELPLRRFPRGMIVFEEGEPTRDIYWIRSGSVEIVRRDGTGDLERFAVLLPGELFGEFSYLTGEPRSASAVAMEETTATEISPRWIDQIVRRHPDVGARLNEIYRLRILTNALRDSRLFRSLSSDELAGVADRMTLRTYRDGEEILAEGSVGLDLFVVKRGRVMISKRKEGGGFRIGEIGPGEILGEMAAVNGEARSASAHAAGECELAVLPGEEFQKLLASHPALLSAAEEVIRGRAAQTRRAVEAIVNEIVGTALPKEGEGGVRVESLRLPVLLKGGKAEGSGLLLEVSPKSFGIGKGPDSPEIPSGTPVEISFGPNRVKGLPPLCSGEPLTGTVLSADGKGWTVGMEGGSDPERIRKIVTLLARERVRFFIYPQYDVEKLGLAAQIRRKGGPAQTAPLVALSQTDGRAYARGDWSPGEVAAIDIQAHGQTLVSTQAVCLASDGKQREFQFEYETSEERAALENAVRGVSRQLGFDRATAAPPRPPDPSVATIARTFKDPVEFLRLYIGSIESRLIRLPCKERLGLGTAVSFQATVPIEKGSVCRLDFTGLVRLWQEGTVEIELDGIQETERGKLEILIQQAMDEKTNLLWLQRKNALSVAAPKPAPPPAAPQKPAQRSFPPRQPLPPARSRTFFLLPLLGIVGGLAAAAAFAWGLMRMMK